MFCPKCGQEQVGDVPNYCSRCGFQLTEVTSLLARGESPAMTVERTAPGKRKRRLWLRFLMAALAFLPLAIIAAEADGDMSVALLGFLTFASFMTGLCLLIASWVKSLLRRRSDKAAQARTTSYIDGPERAALPQAYVPPVSVPRSRFDTGELAEPPSVTEHTTRQLERESSHAPERTGSQQ